MKYPTFTAPFTFLHYQESVCVFPTITEGSEGLASEQHYIGLPTPYSFSTLMWQLSICTQQSLTYQSLQIKYNALFLPTVYDYHG